MTAADWIDNLARLAQAAQELTPGEWVAGDGWVYTPPIYDDDHRLASVLGMKYADRDRANAEHARAQRNAEFIAAANPTTILRLIEENRNLRTTVDADLEYQRRLEARLAAVEALAAETIEDAARVINEVLGGDMDNHARIAAHRLADAGLLATARTATTEDAEEVLHGAGWFARADLDPRDLRGILHDLADADLLRGGA